MVLASADYREEKGKLAEWGAKIARAGKITLRKIEKEIAGYFDSLERKNALVFSYVKIDRKILQEKIIEKRTGRRVIID